MRGDGHLGRKICSGGCGRACRRVDKCYDYIIPDNLMDKIVPGSRVLVPFGPRSVEGFVVARTENLPWQR